MLSITSEYALRALVVLAGLRAGRTMQARELAGETTVPASYLSKILTRLRRSGFLDGSRGIRGGYRLAREPQAIRLIDVVELFEVVRPQDACLLGRSEICSDEQPCSAHDEWKSACRVYENFLMSKTIADLAGDRPEESRA